MSSVGEVENEAYYLSQLPKLFDENVVKIENGCTIVRGHDALSKQLANARNYAFPWKIEILDKVFDSEQHSAAIRFTWNSDKVGLHITTVILKFNDTNQVTEIIEVYNKYADVTH